MEKNVKLEFLFLNGPALPPPFRNEGSDPTDDELGCDLDEEEEA